MNFTEGRATAQLLRALAGEAHPEPGRVAAAVDTLSFNAGAALEVGPVLSETGSAAVCAAIAALAPVADPLERPEGNRQ